MRFAISAMAAASGLLLLALAFYGQPAVYLQQARAQWDMLMDYPLPQRQHGDTLDYAGSMDGPSVAGETADAQRAARLQEEVTRLEAELAARQANLQQPIGRPSPPDRGLQTQTSEPLKTAPNVSGTTGISAAAALPNITEASPSLLPPQAPTRPEAAALSPGAISSSPLEVVTPGSSTALGSLAAGPSKSRQAEAAGQRTDFSQAGSRPSRSAAAARATTGADRRPSSDNPTPRSDVPRSDTPGFDALKADPNRSTPAKQVIQKAIPAPPPLRQTPQQPLSSQQQVVDESETVLARLRQNAQSAPPVELAERSTPSEPRPQSAASATLSRLNAAQAALGGGRVEEARRLLQEAQLQLVFRPVEPADEGPAASGHSAADVARALEAISSNDISSSRRYIDAAVNDLSGNTTAPRLQDANRHNPGYAPAYPPR